MNHWMTTTASQPNPLFHSWLYVAGLLSSACVQVNKSRKPPSVTWRKSFMAPTTTATAAENSQGTGRLIPQPLWQRESLQRKREKPPATINGTAEYGKWISGISRIKFNWCKMKDFPSLCLFVFCAANSTPLTKRSILYHPARLGYWPDKKHKCWGRISTTCYCIQ